MTGMIYAGSGITSTINVPLNGTMGLDKFGPGNLVLSATNSGLRGGILVTSGALNVTSTGAPRAGRQRQ